MKSTTTRVSTKNYARQYTALWPELGPALERAFLTDAPVLGDAVASFERAFAAYLGTRDVVGVNSGTDALVLAMRALGIGPGDEVITAANTFIATVTAIVAVGAKPVLIDPDERTMLLDVAQLRRAIGRNTRAVIPVHLYGRACPMAAIRAAAPECLLIEDAAQAHGARDANGQRVGSLGIASAFSFHPSKNLGAFGDAGAIATSDSALADRLRVLNNLGKSSKYEVCCLAPNTKLDSIQAVVLGIKLAHLDAWNERRRAMAAIYRAELDGIGDLILPDVGTGEHVFHQYVVRTERRDSLRAHLSASGIQTGIHYPIPPHLQPLEEDLGYRPGDFPVTERLARQVVSLPISHELEQDEVLIVCEGVRRFFEW